MAEYRPLERQKRNKRKAVTIRHVRHGKGEKQDIYETTMEERKEKDFRTDGSSDSAVIGQGTDSCPGI